MDIDRSEWGYLTFFERVGTRCQRDVVGVHVARIGFYFLSDRSDTVDDGIVPIRIVGNRRPTAAAIAVDL